MTTTKSLRVGVSWTFVGNVAYAGSQWLLLLFLVRFTSVEEVGRYSLALAITSPIILFANLKLRVVQATDAGRDFRFSDYVAVRFGALTVAMVVLSVIVLVGDYSGSVAVVLLVALFKTIESIGDIIHGLLQQNEQMDLIAKSNILKGLGALSGMVLGWVVTKTLEGGVLGIAVAWAMLVFFYDARNARRVISLAQDEVQDRLVPVGNDRSPQPNSQVWLRLAWLALPMGVAGALESLAANIPRYSLHSSLGDEALGYYAALSYLLVAGTTVTNSIGQAVSPRLARYYRDNLSNYVHLVRRLVILGSVLSVLGIVCAVAWGEEILGLVYHPDYGRYASEFTWVVVAGAFLFVASVLNSGLNATRHFRSSMVVQVITVLVTLLSSLLLVPVHGVLGAAWSLGSGQLARTIVLALMLQVLVERRRVEVHAQSRQLTARE